MPSLIVLAAGMGSRYGGLKQLDPMGPNGETVLDYSVYDAIRAGFNRVIFVIREDFAEAFKTGIGERFAKLIQVDYAYQRLDDLPAPFSPPEGRTKPWGTTHAIRAARALVDGPFAVINADDFYGADAYLQASRFLKSSDEARCGLIAYPLENTLSEHGSVNRGICEVSQVRMLLSVEEVVKISRDPSGEISGIGLNGERRVIAAKALASMNFWAFLKQFMADIETEFFDFLVQNGDKETSEFYIPTVVDALIHKGKTQCEVIETSASWFGVTFPEDKPYVVQSIAELISKGDYPQKLS
ncbi:MAG: NDP-sugar synthase [Akkermansiaceae bacterium]|jgi:NDP-sugar pyrophosphorylase family protein|nr:NTP transferase domain-containing protein [Luteolibacter sp.]